MSDSIAWPNERLLACTNSSELEDSRQDPIHALGLFYAQTVGDPIGYPKCCRTGGQFLFAKH